MLIPDFIEIQRKSFSIFLKTGLINELSKRNSIKNVSQGFEIKIFPEFYRLNNPEWDIKTAILKSKTYACKLYIPIQLLNFETKEIKLQWVLLGNLPLMTKRGHFILNGCPRIIINQMVRSPGIYFQSFLDKNKQKNYYADLISYRGAWLRLEIDKKKSIWAKMKKTPKISIVIFLQAMGLTKQKIFQSINNSEFLQNSILKNNHPITKQDALISLYLETHAKKEKPLIACKLGQKFIYRKFMNPKTYDLSILGRTQLNKKLGLSTPLTKTTLTPNDVLYSTDYLINLQYGIGEIDDIDNLKNRRIRASGEILQNQISIGVLRLEKHIREKLKKVQKNITIRSLISTKPINGALREFFGSSQLSQFMDQTNPLAEITHKRRLSSLGPGGVSRETAGMAVRGIHPTHYGRICPIETPEGPNAGLVNSITTYARVNRNGFLESPFFTVYHGQIQKNFSPIFLSAEKEETSTIAPGDLKKSKLYFLPKHSLPLRIEKQFKQGIRKQINYISISPIQMISIATSLIPFLEHDDANRALMGSNMQRQAVPLVSPERAIVGTGLESRVIADSGHSLQAKQSGYVSYVSSEKIIIQRKNIYKELQLKNTLLINFKNKKAKQKLNLQKLNPTCSLKKRILSRTCKKTLSTKNLNSLLIYQTKNKNLKRLVLKLLTNQSYFVSKQKKDVNSLVYSNVHKNNQIKNFEKSSHLKYEYLLQSFQRSNQETCITHRPVVKKGMWVQKGDILADGAASVGGELALGKNIIVAYMPWEGYNFEDAILINQRLVYDDIYTSIHIEKFDIEIRDTKFGIEQITKQIPELGFSETTHLDNSGIVKIGSWVKEGDILVGKVTPIHRKPLSPHEKLLYDIVGKETPTTRDSSLRVPKGVKGRVIHIEILETQNLAPETSFDGPGRVNVYIAEKRKIQVGDKMAGRHGNKGIISKILPRQDMPFLPDGTPVDMVLNPLGVPSRMNVGQVFESLLGLAGSILKNQYKILPFDESFGADASRSIVYEQLYLARKKTRQNWIFTPNSPGKTPLFDGRTGENFDQVITSGKAYILKLVHLVDEKIHARSTGPYSLITQQPLRGRSKHGGQRLGEMEVWALEGFGASYTLQELLTIKSDDMQGRHQVMDSILKNKSINLGTPESFKVLIRELQSLCLDVRVYGIDSTGTRKQIDVTKLR